jgi:hypothetical protein
MPTNLNPVFHDGSFSNDLDLLGGTMPNLFFFSE